MGKRKRKTNNQEQRRESFIHKHVDANDGMDKRQKLNVFLLTTILVVAGLDYKLYLFLHDSYLSSEISQKNSAGALKRRPETMLRRTWSQENDRINDHNFYRLFRMSRPCFRKLCNKIEKAVGEKVF